VKAEVFNAVADVAVDVFAHKPSIECKLFNTAANIQQISHHKIKI